MRPGPGFSKVAAVIGVALIVGACSGTGSASTAPSGGASGGKVVFLLPEKQTARYEAADRPIFEAKFKALCPSTGYIYGNAAGDDATQLQQAESAFTNGATVLVLDPNDADAAGKIVTEAASKGVKVISYDRLIKGGAKPDYYVEFDSAAVGKLQGNGASMASAEAKRAEGAAPADGPPNRNAAPRGTASPIAGDVRAPASRGSRADPVPRACDASKQCRLRRGRAFGPGEPGEFALIAFAMTLVDLQLCKMQVVHLTHLLSGAMA